VSASSGKGAKPRNARSLPGKLRTARKSDAGSSRTKVKPKKRRPDGDGASALRIGNDERATRAPRTLTELMAQALAMEQEASRRYAEFADAMEVHNNPEVAALFRKMAGIEHKHAQQIMMRMGWGKMPALRSSKPSWDGFEAPETTPGDEIHYLMHPYHVLQLALVNEQRAERFFARLVLAATEESVRRAARKLRAEEAEHVALVKAWMKKVAKPDPNWAADPDPATYTD
jgi:rubrerythrin